MKPLDSVIVGLSLSEHDAHLLSYAAMLAGLGIGKKFQFVHVVTPQLARPGSVDHAEVLRQMQAEVSQPFGHLADRVQCTFDVREGVRLDQMLAFIEQYPSDLVLVAHRPLSHGRQSLAKRLAKICPTSVWMVPHQAPCQIARVLAPIDFSSHSADALCLATKVAKLAGASECLALHVYYDSSMIRYDETIEEDLHHEEDAFEKFIEPIDLHDVNVTPIFDEESDITKAILRIASEQQSDLIVMSTRGRSPAASVLLGSETSQILMDSPIPVLALKHRGAFLNLFQVLTDHKTWSHAEPKAN